MSEQLNERERELALSIIAGMGHSHQEAMLALSAWDKMDVFANLPPGPNLARITELEAEVERLNGLLDEVEAALLDDFDLKAERCEDILSRRTERKERGDTPRRCFLCQGAGSIVAKGEGKAWDVPCPDCGGSGKERGDV